MRLLKWDGFFVVPKFAGQPYLIALFFGKGAENVIGKEE